MASRDLRVTLQRVGAFLEAQRYDPEIADKGVLSKMKTYTAFLENVFGKYYEGKIDLNRRDDIPVDYGVDWDRFLSDFTRSIQYRASTGFTGICSVLYLRTRRSDDARRYVIEDFAVRPCAIGHGFFEAAVARLREAAEVSDIEIHAFTVKSVLVDRLMEKLNIVSNDVQFDHKHNHVPGLGPKTHIYAFPKSAINEASANELQNFRPPPAVLLGLFNDPDSEKNQTLMAMIDTLTMGGSVAYRALPDDPGWILPDFDINTAGQEDLIVYKGGRARGYNTEQAVIVLRYNEANTVGAEQIFENAATRTRIGKYGELALFSNTITVYLKVMKGLNSSRIKRIESINGHRFGISNLPRTKGYVSKKELQSEECFFTYCRGGLTFQANASDTSGKYEYGLEYTPPNSNPAARGAAAGGSRYGSESR